LSIKIKVNHLTCMKREEDIDFISLLQDERFIYLVKNSFDLDDQVSFIEQHYSCDREEILYAIDFFKANLTEQKRLSEEDTALLFQQIKESSETNNGRVRKFVSHRLWKAAAAIVLIFGGAITYYYSSQKDPLEKFAMNQTVATDDAVLVLSDGSKYKLNEDDSKIEYSQDGGNVVVRNKREQDEELRNKQDDSGPVINQIVVPAGHRHSISLSDGTLVVLNSGSKLVFPAEFSGKTRDVYLIGEGYFEVSKNANKPFIVKTEKINVRVLGTKFNISAYADEKVTSTVLVEGSVSVIENGKLLGNAVRKLSPQQGYFYSSETSSSEIKQVDVADYVSWKDGLFRFKDRTLRDVVLRVRKYYNKSILIEGDKLAGTLISGKLVLTDDIDVILNYLTKTLEVRQELQKDGSYIIKE